MSPQLAVSARAHSMAPEFSSVQLWARVPVPPSVSSSQPPPRLATWPAPSSEPAAEGPPRRAPSEHHAISAPFRGSPDEAWPTGDCPPSRKSPAPRQGLGLGQMIPGQSQAAPHPREAILRGHRRRVSVASGGHEPWNCQAAPRRGGGALCAESLQAAGGTGCDSGCSLKPAALPECPVPTRCRRREFGEVWPREGCLGRVCGHPWSSHPGHRVGGAQGGRSAPHTRTPPQRVAWPRRPDVSGAGGACPRPPCARHGGLSGALSLRLPAVGGRHLSVTQNSQTAGRGER